MDSFYIRLYTDSMRMTTNSPLGRGGGWVADAKIPERSLPTPCPSHQGNRGDAA